MRALVAVSSIAALSLLAGVASADVTVSFTRITNNGTANPAAQLSCVISDAGGGQVNFRFLNNVSGGIAASITDVYFDDGTLLGISSIFESAGVSFTQGASPSNLPGGNAVNFETTAGFSADSDSPTAANGVNASSEWLDVRFNLINGKTYADTIAALALGGAEGGLRIGIHVQAIGTEGQSESFVNGGNPPPPVIPLPTAGAMGLAGLMGLAAVRRRR